MHPFSAEFGPEGSWLDDQHTDTKRSDLGIECL